MKKTNQKLRRKGINTNNSLNYISSPLWGNNSISKSVNDDKLIDIKNGFFFSKKKSYNVKLEMGNFRKTSGGCKENLKTLQFELNLKTNNN